MECTKNPWELLYANCVYTILTHTPSINVMLNLAMAVRILLHIHWGVPLPIGSAWRA